MADEHTEKSLDDFFAKRDKKKKKEKGKGKESAAGPTSMVVKKTKREKEKSAKNENQDTQIEKVSKRRCSSSITFLPPRLYTSCRCRVKLCNPRHSLLPARILLPFPDSAVTFHRFM